MSLQKYFKNFNNKIKMDYEEKSELASKRDILLKKLRDSGQLPSFTELNQGNDVTEKTVKAVAQEKPYYAVFRDSSMANDSVATNFEQIFATYSPETVRKVL